MPLFFFISKYFWLVAIVAASINGMLWRKRAQKHIERDPSLKMGYDKLMRGYLFYHSLPWVVMGLGSTLGGVPSVWHYFKPRDGNLFVLAWFATIFCLWGLGTFWLFFRGGAETLVRYPGVILFRGFTGTKEVTSSVLIKTFWLSGVVGGIIGVALMWYVFPDFPIPDFDAMK